MILDPESELRRLIAIARVLPTRFETEVDTGLANDVISRYDFPAFTALARVHWATAQYEPAVAVLGDGRTVHGTMLLLRGLLELWADFLYLTEKADPAERRIRAIEMEIGDAREKIHTMRIAGIAEPEHMAEGVAVVTHHLERLEETKRLEGWTARGRPYGQVTDWLDKTALDWPTPMYRGFSGAAHHHMTEWATGETTSPEWQFRALRLEQCVVIYGNIAHWALQLVGPKGDGTFNRAVRELLDDEILGLAMDGQLD